MFCFNCTACITQKIPYGYADSKVGLVQFFENLSIGFCSRCKIPQVEHAALSPEKLNQYYSFVYRSKTNLEPHTAILGCSPYFTARADAQIALIKKYISQSDVRHVFEFGAGYGYALKAIQRQFPSAKLYTNECDQTIKFLSDIHQYAAEIQYDVVIMSHVLEHLEYPQNYLANILNNLKKGGILFIEVPVQTQELRQKNVIMEPHVTFFTLSTLRSFMSRHFGSQLEILYSGTAGRYTGDIGLLTRVRRSIRYRFARLLRLPLKTHGHGSMGFDNDTRKNVWDNVRIVCRNR